MVNRRTKVAKNGVLSCKNYRRNLQRRSMRKSFYIFLHAKEARLRVMPCVWINMPRYIHVVSYRIVSLS